MFYAQVFSKESQGQPHYQAGEGRSANGFQRRATELQNGPDQNRTEQHQPHEDNQDNSSPTGEEQEQSPNESDNDNVPTGDQGNTSLDQNTVKGD